MGALFLAPQLEQTLNDIVRGYLRRAFGHNSARARQARLWAEVVEQVIPSTKPQVSAHQRQVLTHARLAAEIGWRGPQALVRGGR